jgi:hypothetical protein
MYLHCLPFCIGYSGRAEVDQAFPVVINNETDTFESAFRGRKLSGRSHELPHSLNGNLTTSLLHFRLILASIVCQM